VLLVSGMKFMKKAKKTSVKVEVAPAEAVKPAQVKAKAPPSPRVVLELVNPAATQVFVAGSFNNWQPEQTPLIAAGNGRWASALQVAPGRHEYLFVVDGQWLPDPNAKESVENPFGGRNSVLTVSE
jgi:1,4-alpha-glucan branching enzyme